MNLFHKLQAELPKRISDMNVENIKILSKKGELDESKYKFFLRHAYIAVDFPVIKALLLNSNLNIDHENIMRFAILHRNSEILQILNNIGQTL